MKHMFVFTFVVLATSCQAYHDPEVFRSDRDNEVHSHVHVALRKRSVQTELGKAAVKLLLTDSLKSKVEAKTFKKYFKQGNWYTAYRDFLSVKPTTITKTKYPYGGKIYKGKIGDHTIALKTTGRAGNKSTTLTIAGPEAAGLPTKIFYKKTVNKHYYER